MKKNIVSLVICVMIIFSLSSCGIDYRISLDEDIHELVECHADGIDVSSYYIIYKDTKYTCVGEAYHFIQVDDKENDIFLSWNGYRWFGYVDEYYSYTDDSPIYIYEGNHGLVYFREDYNFFDDTFIIENTNEEIIFSDICSDEYHEFDYNNPIKVVLRSKTNNRIKIVAELLSINDRWYISFEGATSVWIASDLFVGILESNSIL